MSIPDAPLVLGIETSCDETGLALYQPGQGLLAHALFSQVEMHRARRRAEAVAGVYVASLSFRTVTYKALCAATQLASFYPDLADPAWAVSWAIFHQRFSTNTEPSWERAQALPCADR